MGVELDKYVAELEQCWNYECRAWSILDLWPIRPISLKFDLSLSNLRFMRVELNQTSACYLLCSIDAFRCNCLSKVFIPSTPVGNYSPRSPVLGPDGTPAGMRKDDQISPTPGKGLKVIRAAHETPRGYKTLSQAITPPNWLLSCPLASTLFRPSVSPSVGYLGYCILSFWELRLSGKCK